MRRRWGRRSNACLWTALISMAIAALALGQRMRHELTISGRHSICVTGRRDLTNSAGLDSREGVLNTVEPYFTHNGLDMRSVRDLRIAWMSYRDPCFVLRFAASDDEIAKLLEGKEKRDTTEVLGELRREGTVSTGLFVVGDTVMGPGITSFSFLQEYPFDCLRWWPPKSKKRGALETYEARGPRQGFYYIFVDRDRGFVWLLATNP